MASLLTDNSINKKIHLTKVKLAYAKLCPKDLLTDEEQQFINAFTIEELTTDEIINEKYEYVVMKINGISSKVEGKIKEYTKNDFTCKDDNGKPFSMCLEKLSASDIEKIEPQLCATGGKKRHRKTGKKHRHQRRQRRQTRRHRR